MEFGRQEPNCIFSGEGHPTWEFLLWPCLPCQAADWFLCGVLLNKSYCLKVKVLSYHRLIAAARALTLGLCPGNFCLYSLL